MENATKALLIAAAVLVAIIIISLGVYVVSLAQNQMKGAESGLNDVEIQSFNSTYKSYEGTSVSGTKVKALVDAVYNHNLTESDESRKIELVDGTNATILAKEQEDPTQKPTIKTGISINLVLSFFFPLVFGLLFTF